MRASSATAPLLAAVLLFCPSLASTEVAHDSAPETGRGLTKRHHHTARAGKAHTSTQHVPVLLTKDTKHRRLLITNDEQEEEDETAHVAADDSQDEAEFDVDDDDAEDEADSDAQDDEDASHGAEEEESEDGSEREPADPTRSGSGEGKADGNDGDGASTDDESADDGNKQSAGDESTDEDVRHAVDESEDAESEGQVTEDDEDVTAQSDDVEADQSQDKFEESTSEVVGSLHVSDGHTNDEEEETVHSPASNQYPRQTASAGGGNANARAPMIISSSSQQTQTASSITAQTKSATIRRGPLARIKGIFGVSSSAKTSKINAGGGRKWRKRKKQTPEEMLYHDITLAFINGLKSGLYDDLEKPLSVERKQLLLDWCDLLSATLPPEFGLHRVINLLRSNWIHISSSRRNLMSILSVSLPAEKDYSDECTQPTKKRLFGSGSNTKSPARGSNCAFWRLLHTLSVGLAERKGGTDASTDDEVLRDVDAALGVVGGKHRRNHRPFSPKEAAEIIRNVVDTFFTCEVCRKNFVEQYNSCQYGRCVKLKDTTEGLTEDDWREMSLWLWQYHNGVTSTISNKAAESTNARAVSSGLAWPSAKDCSSCKLNDGRWDHMHVYQYLREVYWGDEEASISPVDTAYRMGDLNVLDAKSTVILVATIVVILASIRLWSRRYLLKHNIGYLPLSSHLNGKTSGKKE